MQVNRFQQIFSASHATAVAALSGEAKCFYDAALTLVDRSVENGLVKFAEKLKTGGKLCIPLPAELVDPAREAGVEINEVLELAAKAFAWAPGPGTTAEFCGIGGNPPDAWPRQDTGQIDYIRIGHGRTTAWFIAKFDPTYSSEGESR